MPVTPTVESFQDLRNDLICKFSVGAAIIADYTAAPITTLFTAGVLNALPAGYASCGLIDTTGLVLKRAMTVAEVMSWQSAQVQRSDVQSDVLTVEAKFQEAIKPPVVALRDGLTLAATPALGATTFSVDRSDDSVQPYRRLLLIGHDTKLDVIMAQFFPRVAVTAVGDETWSRANETQVDITFGVYSDSAYGTSARRFVGGAGWAALAPAAWAATTAYALNTVVTLGAGTVKCTTAGTSGSTAPTLPGSVGGTVTDGTVVWTRVS